MIYMKKCFKLLIFCTFRPGPLAWFHMVRGFEAKVPFLSSEAKILQGSNTEPLAVSMVCVAMEPALGAPAET